MGVLLFQIEYMYELQTGSICSWIETQELLVLDYLTVPAPTIFIYFIYFKSFLELLIIFIIIQ